MCLEFIIGEFYVIFFLIVKEEFSFVYHSEIKDSILRTTQKISNDRCCCKT